MADDFPPRIGSWVPLRLLGRGAMAAVFLCEGPDGQTAALKWMDRPHPPLVRRFEREIASLRRLDHPGIVRFLEHGVHLGRPYYVMDHIDGIDLRLYSEKLAQRPPKERYARCRLIGRSLSETLAYLHSQGLVHRDVKPSNVLVAHDQRIVLTDFGVVKDLADSEQTQVGLMVGTPAFAAPEQVEGTEVDHRADLFGLGGTLYYVLTCKVPFASRDRRVRARPAAPSDTDPAVPPDLEAVVLRLMAPDAQHRFPDAAAVGRALATDSNEGVPVAGRKQALEAVATALEDARRGVPVVVRPEGPKGAGKGWLSDTVRQAARRHGVAVHEARTEAEVADALEALAANPRSVLVSPLPVEAPPGCRTVTVPLPPLGVADVRRTVVGAAPLTAGSAQVAERLHRFTGGLPGLLVPLIQRHRVGQALQLPEELVPPDIVSDFLQGLDPDQQEVLWALSLLDAPSTTTVVEEAVQVPTEDVLEELKGRGLILSVGNRWHVAADAFRVAALEECWDVEGLKTRLVSAQSARSGGDPPLEDTLEALLERGGTLAARGHLAAAQALAERAAGTARAIGHRVHECTALCVLGQVLLDLGAPRRAGSVLADATALARATDRGDLRRLSHALRAQANLVVRKGSRTACIAALDRLIPITTGATHRPPDVSDAVAFATLSWTAQALGDTPTAQRAAAQAEARLPVLVSVDRLRVELLLARASLAGRDGDAVRERLTGLRDVLGSWPLLDWQARRLVAAAEGEAAPSPEALVEGLSPEDAQTLAAWP